MTDIDREQQCVSLDDDELRHAYLEDATVLLDDVDVYVVPADEPDEKWFKARLGRAPRPTRFDR